MVGKFENRDCLPLAHGGIGCTCSVGERIFIWEWLRSGGYGWKINGIRLTMRLLKFSGVQRQQVKTRDSFWTLISSHFKINHRCINVESSQPAAFTGSSSRNCLHLWSIPKIPSNTGLYKGLLRTDKNSLYAECTCIYDHNGKDSV